MSHSSLGALDHRDLKPANIMLVADPVSAEGERVRVLDFGIAKIHTDQHTRRGTLLGTPAYMALEQIIDSAVVDGKADVFSLGVMLYELLAGRLPHKPGQPEVMLGKRMLEPITPIQELLPLLPPKLGELIMAMLSQESVGRPTMAEVDRELRRARGLPPVRSSGFYQTTAPGNDPPVSADPPTVGTISLGPQPTPSGERVLGEVSPLPIPVPPPSLSSMPSVEAPALRAGPHDRTAPGAPTPLPVGAVALPSAPTTSGSLGRRAFYALSAALTVCAVLTVVVARWPHKPSPEPAHPASSPGAGMAPVTTPQVAPVPPMATPTPATATPAPATATPTPATATPTSTPGTTEAAPDNQDKKTAQISTGAVSHRPSEPKATSSSSGRSRCPAVVFTDDCVKGKNLSPDLRRNVLLALRDRPMRMCAGDRLVIGTGTDGVRLLETPARLSDTAKQDFLLTLRGYLDVTPRAGKIEIQCPERQP